MLINQRLLNVRHVIQYPDADPVIYDSTQDAETRGDATALAKLWTPHLETTRPHLLQPNGQLVRAEPRAEEPSTAPATIPSGPVVPVPPPPGARLMPPVGLQEGLFRIPNNELMLNQRWVETKTVPWRDQTEAVKVTVAYTYQGEEQVEQQMLDRIQVGIQWEILPATDGSLPIVMERQNGGGVVYFDAEQGHIARSETSMKLIAWLPRDAGDSQAVEVTIEQKLRILPAAPVPDTASQE
jgi:hypothetical protein